MSVAMVARRVLAPAPIPRAPVEDLCPLSRQVVRRLQSVSSINTPQ